MRFLLTEMKLNLRSKLLIALVLIAAVPLGAISSYFLSLMHGQRVELLLGTEAEQLDRARARLETVLRLAQVVDLSQLSNVPEILWTREHPCDASNAGRTALSSDFATLSARLTLKPDFAIDADVHELCKSLSVASTLRPEPIRLLPTRVQLMVPYLRVVTGGGPLMRLSLISMESLGTSADSTLMLADLSGRVIWAADGDSYLNTALADTGTQTGDLAAWLKQSARTDTGTLSGWIGHSGLLSAGLVGKSWILGSLTYAPRALEPIAFARSQMLLLVLGFLLIALFFGRRLAIAISAPFAGLQQAAERIGSGDLEGRFEVKGTDEIAAVHRAFNQMTTQIEGLLAEKAKQAELQSELKLANQVQKMLLPPPQIQLRKHRIESVVRFAAACGGDFWYPIDLGDSCLIVIADATGHGVAPALVTGVMRGAVTMLSEWILRQPEIASDTSAVLTQLNRIVFDAAQGMILMSAFLAHLEPSRGEVIFGNAGHCFPYMITPGDGEAKISPLQVAGHLLGAERNLVYAPELIHRMPWAPGSRLFLYTDGLLDFPGSGGATVFDRRRMIKTIKAHAKSPDFLKQFMEEHAKAVKGAPQSDDLTVIVVEAL